MKKKSPLIAKALGAVRNCLVKHNISKDSTVIVACSGGQDSLCLLGILNLLKNLHPLNIIVGHIHHGIRKESDDEEIHLRNICATINLPIEVKYLRLTKQNGLANIARDARYEALYEISKQYDSAPILLAHTKTDNVETVLMHLIRGSGLNGLEGIRDRIYHSKCHIIRPILDLSREETALICNLLELTFVSDPTNVDKTNFRIRLRNEIVPALERENPKFADAIGSLSNQVLAVNDYIDKQTLHGKYFSTFPEGLVVEHLAHLEDWLIVINDLRKNLQNFGIDISELKYTILTEIYESIFSTVSKQFHVKPNIIISVDPKNKKIYIKSIAS